MALWTPVEVGSGPHHCSALPLTPSQRPLTSRAPASETAIPATPFPFPHRLANTRKGPRRRIRARSTMAILSRLPTRVAGRQPILARLSSPAGLLAGLLAYPCSTSPSMASTHGGSEPLPPPGATAKKGHDDGGGSERAASGTVEE
jgi:hypothetical protein